MNTTKPKTPTTKTLLTFNDAKHKIVTIIDILIANQLRFTLQSRPKELCFLITGVECADAMKHLIPQCDIEMAGGARYAVLKINYSTL